MAFVPITDLKEADKLWEAGLLWFKFKEEGDYFFDNTYDWPEEHARDLQRPTSTDHVDYFILVEE